MVNSVLILKELEGGYNTGKPVSGILRTEASSGLIELSLSLINLVPITNGNYYLYMFGEKGAVYTFLLPPRPVSFRKTLDGLIGLTKGYASALVVVKDTLPLTIAFGKTEGFELSLSNAKKLIAEKCFSDRKTAIKKQAEPEQVEDSSSRPKTSPYTQTTQFGSSVTLAEPEQADNSNFRPKASPHMQTTQLASSVTLAEPEQADNSNFRPKTSPQTILDAYNDEAVATVNYFEIDQELRENLDKIKDLDNESLSNANGQTIDSCQKEKEENANGADFLSHEEDVFSSQSDGEQKQKPFYITAEKELTTLFDRFPAYDNLKCYFPDSRWVKINYKEDKYYIVGVIKEDKKEKYICYGVPEKYSPNPPEELKGYCTFIPLSIFDMQGEGFWMMFQDAITGSCINNPKG